MSTMSYDDEMGSIQRALSQCHDMVVRRSAVLAALNLRSGEHVLEIGCGGGFYAYESGRFVGPSGRVCAVDISADQVAAARTRCADLDWVECRVADAVDLPYEDALFDKVYSVQTIEYIPELDNALHEIRRLLRPGGRFVNLATNWSSVVWHSNEPERMKKVLAAWDEHAPYPDLPAILAARLRRVSLQPHSQTPVPIVNMSYNENAGSYWTAKLIQQFVIDRQTVTEEMANAWLDEFNELEASGAYFYCSAPILTDSMKIT